MGGGGGGTVGTGRNNMSLQDRSYAGVPYPNSPGNNPYTGFTPGANVDYNSYMNDNPSLATGSADAFFGSLLGTGNLALGGADILAANSPGSDLSPYMNPFQNDVINTTMGELNRQKTLAGNDIEDAAIRSGAFGGSRHGVRESMLDRQYADTQAQTLSQLNSQNFQNAQNQQQFFGNLGAGLASNNLAQLGNLSNLGFGMTRQLSQDQLAAGGLQQQMQQQLIDAAKQQFGQYANWPAQSYAFQSILPQIGQAGTTHSQTTTPINPLGSILGLFGSLI